MNWLRRMMIGRNGGDQLSFAMLALSIFFLILNMFLRFWPLTLLYYLCVAGALFRILSRNVPGRQRENTLFLLRMDKIRAGLRLYRGMFRERKAYRHPRCPQCRQWLRVPRGKGKLRITCTKCRRQFVKKV